MRSAVIKRALLLLVMLVVPACGITSDAHAGRRGIPIPIIRGSGEKMVEMAELAPEVSRVLEEELGTRTTIGFPYEQVHLFYPDLWTWNERHVIHVGDRYSEPDGGDWQEMIGEELAARYGKPFR